MEPSAAAIGLVRREDATALQGRRRRGRTRSARASIARRAMRTAASGSWRTHAIPSNAICGQRRRGLSTSRRSAGMSRRARVASETPSKPVVAVREPDDPGRYHQSRTCDSSSRMTPARQGVALPPRIELVGAMRRAGDARLVAGGGEDRPRPVLVDQRDVHAPAPRARGRSSAPITPEPTTTTRPRSATRRW